MKRLRSQVALITCSLLVLSTITGCGAGTRTGVVPDNPSLAAAAAMERASAPLAFGRGKITHVVVIMQENRSLDNLFHAFPGANTVDFGYGHGKKYKLHPTSLAYPVDINHAHYQFLEDYDYGKMDGFDLNFQKFDPHCDYADPINHPKCWVFLPTAYYRTAFAYVPKSEIKPYWTLAKQYALGDNMFASNNGNSYPSHQYMISGQSNHVAEGPSTPNVKGFGGLPVPWGCDGPNEQTTTMLFYGPPPMEHASFSPPTGHEITGEPHPCFSYATAATLLDAAHVSWTYYAPQIYGNAGDIWSAFDAIWQVRFGSDWINDVKSPETTILTDISAGTLPSVSWVVPSFTNSDHAGSLSLTGPDWVAAVVNAIGKSKYWNSTAIVVMWDDWGGWYDHVAPRQIPNASTRAFEGLGFRVPVLIISPYAKAGYISHQRHEIASSLRFIENVFHLPSLGQADARTDGFNDMFDFTQTPIRFKKVPTTLQATDFLQQRASSQPPDD
jgi:phospholipase C